MEAISEYWVPGRWQEPSAKFSCMGNLSGICASCLCTNFSGCWFESCEAMLRRLVTYRSRSAAYTMVLLHDPVSVCLSW